MIEINNLKKSYGDLLVLDNISTYIEKGKIYGLIGRSGAGKSTLLRCINGLETYDSGSMVVDGIEVNNLSKQDIREMRKGIGMIFQQFSLLSRLTVYDNISFPLRCWKYDEKYIDKKVKELLEVVGLPDKINTKPSELSGGQKQRVAIARALALDPKILLCDEATSALDPNTAKAITSLLNEINQQLGITIVIVTHQMSVVRSTCQEIAILESGKIVVTGAPEDIFIKQPQALKNLIGEKDFIMPQEGINLKILLSSEISDQPVITQMARSLDIDFAILGGETESYRDKKLGSIIINADFDDADKIQRYLTEHSVTWNILDDIDPELEVATGEEIYV